MTVDAIRPEAELLHEPQMAQRQVEVLPVVSEVACFRQDGTRHEDSVTHLVVEWHRFFHHPSIGESEIGGLADEGDISRVSRAFR